jgi:1-acyl-sn-glycerol-3-phosphate acyltransferase
MTTPTLLKPFNPRVLFTTLRGVLIVAPWLLHLFATDIALSALLPISFVAPTAAYNVASKLAYLVWLGVQIIFTKLNRARITTSGDTLPRHESALVIANHVSWADFYLIQHQAIRAGMLGRCRWFAKQQLKWVPFLGWGLWAMGMPLISRKWDKDQKELDRVFRGPKEFKWPICEPIHRSSIHRATTDQTAQG